MRIAYFTDTYSPEVNGLANTLSRLGDYLPVVEMYLAWFYRFAHRVMAPSRHTLEALFRKRYRNLGLWSRGIDAALFNPACRNEELRNRLGKGKFLFLYVGRLSPEKSLDTLLYAAVEMERRFPGKTAFVFTGDGPYAETIRQRKLPNTVLTGFKSGSELSEIYASADCFAFPSGTETFGNAALEALSSGLPVAGVASGGITDFLFHGNNALLCPKGSRSGDNREAFLENLVTLMEDTALRLSLAENARKTALSRDWNRVFDGLISTYAEVIDEQRQRTWQRAS
jgi:glycosyltransferase involved in cell wall biosynthesis